MISINNFNRKINEEALILLYHGVTDYDNYGLVNSSGKHINHKEFEKQMEYIANRTNIISLDEFLEIKSNSKPLPPKTTIVTFDDGFKNNLTVAAPILEKYQIKTTFYISAGIINENKMFWVDIIEDCILRSKKKVITLKNFSNNFADIEIADGQKKIIAINKVKSFAKSLRVKKKNILIENLIEATNIQPSSKEAKEYEVMTWNDIRELNSNPLFSIGGHSMYHDILTSLSKKDMERDVVNCQNLLTNKLGQEIRHFSYPEGKSSDYDDNLIEVLRKIGVKCSPTAELGLNSKDLDPFKLKRVMVGMMDIKFPFSL